MLTDYSSCYKLYIREKNLQNLTVAIFVSAVLGSLNIGVH